MPMPKPEPEESQSEFLARCMSDETMREEYTDVSQRYAVCQNQWERKDEE